MTFKQRLPYFLVGLTIGIFLVIFVFGKKGASFDYLPNARVLKDINKKERVYSNQALADLEVHQLDTAQVSLILKTGNVNFSKKEKLENGCTSYLITGKKELETVTLKISNCERTATVESVIRE